MWGSKKKKEEAPKTEAKTCFYEVLGVARTATAEELKKAYRASALKWHPDKNQDQVELASAKFKEIQEAWEILGDPQERAWYDDHREAVLSGKGNVAEGGFTSSDDDALDLQSYFAPNCYKDFGDGNKGFYAVYADIFKQIDDLENRTQDPEQAKQDRPGFGHSGSDEYAVRLFYSYWAGFVSLRTFSWKDRWRPQDGDNRKVRRLMDAENKKERAKARKDYNDLIRELVASVKKRDKRVLAMASKEKLMEEQKQREEADRKRLQAELNKAQREAFQIEQAERMRQQDIERRRQYGDLIDEDEKDSKKGPGIVLECVPCKKQFKSEKAYANHENSKKHKDTVRELKDYFYVDEPPAAGAEGVDESGMLRCEICEKSFSSRKQLQKHNGSAAHLMAVEVFRQSEEANADSESEDDDRPNGDQDAEDKESEAGDEEEEGEEDEDEDTPPNSGKPSAASAKPPAKSAPKRAADSDEDDGSKDGDEGEDEDEDEEEEAAEESPKPTNRRAQRVSPAKVAPVKATKSAPSNTVAADDEDDGDASQEEDEAPPAQPTASKGPDVAVAPSKRDRREARKEKKKSRLAARADAELARKNGDQPPQDGRELGCTVCGASFSSRSKLFKHLETAGHHTAPSAKPVSKSAVRKGKK